MEWFFGFMAEMELQFKPQALAHVFFRAGGVAGLVAGSSACRGAQTALILED